ncbi:MAG: Ig-like domain-containing protein, partial [Terriglobia bacterium]
MDLKSRKSLGLLGTLCACMIALAALPLGAQSSPAALYHEFDKSGSAAHDSGQAKAIEAVQPVAAHATPNSSPLTGIRILPSSVSLAIPLLNQRIVVEGTYADGHVADVTSQALVKTSNPGVAQMDKQGFVHPEGNGGATLTASFKDFHATVPVAVKNFTAPFEWSFRNHVLPVMTKMGCNSGPCHGAAAGKNGFKLTLRGYDPVTDYYT